MSKCKTVQDEQKVLELSVRTLKADGVIQRKPVEISRKNQGQGQPPAEPKK